MKNSVDQMSTIMDLKSNHSPEHNTAAFKTYNQLVYNT